MLLSVCASDPAPSEGTNPELLAELRRTTVGELAETLRLAPPDTTSSAQVVLQGRTRLDRVVLYPGTKQLTVRGERLEAQDPVRREDGTVTLSRRDANQISVTWRTVGPVPEGRSSSRVEVPPPLPTRHDPEPVVRTPPPNPWSPGMTAAERAAWGVPLRREWRYIVIHHSATPDGNAARFHQSHLERGWDGLGYDFVIGNGQGSDDGQVEVGYRWTQQKVGAHAGNDLMNQHGIGICLVGDFTKHRPSARQMDSLQRLCDFLAVYCGIPPAGLKGHRDVRDTECPGPLFPREFRIRASSAEFGRR